MGQLKWALEDACHNRGAFTATVVKVTGTKGDGGDECNSEWGLLCIHEVFWSSYAFAPPICMCMFS